MPLKIKPASKQCHHLFLKNMANKAPSASATASSNIFKCMLVLVKSSVKIGQVNRFTKNPISKASLKLRRCHQSNMGNSISSVSIKKK
jgi:hypothetical protein